MPAGGVIKEPGRSRQNRRRFNNPRAFNGILIPNIRERRSTAWKKGNGRKKIGKCLGSPSDCRVLIRMLDTVGITISVGYFETRIFQEIKPLRAEEILRPVVTFVAFGYENKEAPEREEDNEEIAKGQDFEARGQKVF